MQPEKKYVAPDGYEYFMCPFTKMYISQGSNTWSHSGVMANDVTNGDGSKAPYYAPCSCRCEAVYPKSGQSQWVSLNPVHLANGKISIVHFTVAHDDSFNAYVGMTLSQGNQIGNMGVKGIGTGVHAHIQVGVGQSNVWGIVKGYFTLDGIRYPVYGFQYEPYDLDDCYFVNDTVILNGAGGNWKTCTPSSGVAPKPSAPTPGEKIDQILHVGSYVTSGALNIGDVKKINGDECVMIKSLGGYFPTRFVSEYDASDGKKDNYLANQKARVYVDRCRVDAVNVSKNLVQIHGIWVNPTPLVEVA